MLAHWVLTIHCNGRTQAASDEFRRSKESLSMPVSDDFITFLIDQFSGWGEVTSRKMFGGAGLYRDGKMFGLVADDVAYLKVDDSNREDFVRAGSSPFKPYPDKATTMSYYEIPPDVLEDPGKLVEWSERSLAIQRKKK